ncbi:MAG: hypothetical protein H7Z37_03140 [Pyrinomonadaceae bacterium]|nr:hypothetical protein [Pyrinomonadaceae bacterium]
MRNNLYAPIRCGADGSMKTVRHESLKTFLTDAFAAILLASFFILATMFILTDPLEMFAPQPMDAQRISGLNDLNGLRQRTIEKIDKGKL